MTRIQAGYARSGGVTDSQAQAWQEQMVRAFPDIKPGDRLTGVHVPGAATRQRLRLSAVVAGSNG